MLSWQIGEHGVSRLIWCVWGLCGIVVAGCGPAGSPSDPPRSSAAQDQAPLRVAAASDLTYALPDVLAAFEGETRIKAEAVFGVSGQLSAQIKQGAPYDLFLAANESYIADLAAAGAVVPATVKAYTQGSLVVALRSEIGDRVHAFEDLAGPEFKRIAIANPAFAPYGRAAKQALERSGLWARVESRVVLGESVRQALVYLERGEVEAAIVGRALVRGDSYRMLAVDRKLYDPIVQGMGVIVSSKRQDDARRLQEFILGVKGREILGRYGFIAAPDQRG